MKENNFSVIRWAEEFLLSCPVDHVDIKTLGSFLRDRDITGYLNYDLTCPMSDEAFQFCYLAKEFLKKFEGFDVGADTRAVAVRNFFAAEQQCAETNKRVALNGSPELKNDLMESLLTDAALLIRKTLGARPRLPALLRCARWTDGSDSANPYGYTSSYQKYAVQHPEVTQDALDLGHIFVNASPRWSAYLSGSLQKVAYAPASVLKSQFKIINGNRVTFVKKNAKTDRGIAVEPHLNGYLQRAVGICLREKLKDRAGIDLRSQELNQLLAHLGSVTNDIATLDISMASDTVSTALVYRLLPTDWFVLLNSLRSKQGELTLDPGTPERRTITIEYEKFSSMGNGFTFELETLIFWALAKVCEARFDAIPGYISVYGDDIVVPSSIAASLSELLQYSGFKLNSEKSFVDGPFRESCGKDYLHGKNIRPFYVKKFQSLESCFYKLANNIRHYAGNCQHRPDIVHWLKSHYSCLISWLTVGLGDLNTTVLQVPANYGSDSGLHVTLEELSLKANAKTGFWHLKFLRQVPDVDALMQKSHDDGRQGRRLHYHLLVMVALQRIKGSVDIVKLMSTLDEPVDLKEDTLLYNICKGSPVRWTVSHGKVGVWVNPTVW